jgi:prolyl-tRNA synthetase
MNSTFLDEDGTAKFYEMGCYGIGVTRIMASSVEQGHDEHGIVWPKAIAPYEVAVILANQDVPDVTEHAERIYKDLISRGTQAVLDDRDERAGAKFADADLIGYPVQAVVGKRGVGAGTVDLKLRATGERTTAPLGDATRAIEAMLASAP